MATTPASIDGHPIHSILVAFPIGLWTFSLVCDLMYRFGSGEPLWHSMASYAVVTGVIGALAAAVPGLIDFFSITDPRAGKVAVAHLAVNVSLVLLFSLNAWLRTALAASSVVPLLLSILGIAGLVVAGWLGGELVYTHKVGVSSDGSAAGATRRNKQAA